ncbi:23S rRNA (pseudouridine(1915)-N(3))-methyltransferase RlmH [Methylophilaceae bacterium]|nr:23S rRNA (pseudouridine(1915)-N(3))-methyltransferase RlmH [Methylophilaceae bacterium]
MKIKIISIGNSSPKSIQDILFKYTSRFVDHFKIELLEIKSEKKFKSVEQKKLQEAQKILKLVGTDFIVSLDENGSSCSSIGLSEKLSNWMQNFPKVTFIIGGADGLDKKIIEKSNWVWSLSELTLPHNLVKVILVEQIYRASTILNNHPYHRE